jgi:hypothetical protein
MCSRILPVLCLFLLVPLAVQAAPSDVEARLSVLEPVRVSPYHGEPGEGLKLTFASLKPNPALALFSLEDARAVVAALEGGFKEAKPGPRPLAAVAMGALTAGMAGGSPGTRLPDFERRVREEHEELYGPDRPC